MAYRILDLFCGAGGAAQGYANAGFEVAGVDNVHMPRYPFPFYRGNALNVVDTLVLGGSLEDACEVGQWPYAVKYPLRLEDFDAIHASPPCQVYSVTRHVNSRVSEYPDLVGPVRESLKATGLPYIIENVPGAPLENPEMLCGTMFGLRAYWPEPQQQKWVELRRHRLFETNWPFEVALACDHRYESMPVYGHGVGGNRVKLKGPGQARVCREVMGIDWMQRRELDEAIPPAYTEYIGTHLRKHLDSTSTEEAA